eukprot:TRINITY_DN9590_c0_g3_i1.p3 TRINITY_DN9590_c0_g3~~TRINITY_DN9590_c0_g3_i1.p3  ORF type:complete len:141 (+),score=45.41 TRINITY_DN9590_c0_g3_i1:587-1009(+)
MSAVTEIEVSLMVLLIDVAATRGFADSAERAAMARTIETMGAIVQLLAGYDVNTVAEMLQEAGAEGRLPPAVHEALRSLEQNLRAYQPYLPKSCLPAQERDDVASNPQPSLSSVHVDDLSAGDVGQAEASVIGWQRCLVP